MLLPLLAAAPVAIWIYLVTLRGGYWRMRRHLLPEATGILPGSKITAVIPARNEADVIGTAIRSLLRQDLVQPLHIVLVDDGSSDGTAQAARQAAEDEHCSSQLSLVDGQPLPPGWTGKLWALSQGVELAAATRPDYLLLTDADIEHAPGVVGKLLMMAHNGGYDLASLMVKLATTTLAEQLLIPAFVYFFLQLYPPQWISNRRATTAGAAGGCILIRYESLLNSGGLQVIAGEVIDDCALARLIKRNGDNVWLGLSTQTKSLRSYGGFRGVGRMISRSAFYQLNHSSGLLILTLAGLTVTYVVPPLLLFTRKRSLRLLGCMASLLMIGSYLPAVRLYRHPMFAVVTLPLVAIFYAGATAHSAWRYWTGRGGEWKGRVQDSKH